VNRLKDNLSSHLKNKTTTNDKTKTVLSLENPNRTRTHSSMSEQRKAVIKNADMSEDMQQEAVDCASQALSKYNIEKVSFWQLLLS